MADSPKRKRKPKRPDPGRALKQALEAGLSVARVEIDCDKVVIFAGKPQEAGEGGSANPWDTIA